MASGSATMLTAMDVILSGGEACPSGLRDLWRKGRHCDAEILIGDQLFVAHRAVLASASEVFDGLFSAPSPPNSSPLCISEVEEPSAFASILTFIYDGECQVPSGSLESMLSSACSLKITSLRDALASVMTQRLGPGCCVRSWRLAEQHSLQGLALAARDKCVEFFGDLNDTVLLLTFEQMRELLADDALAAPTEEDVFKSLESWQNHRAVGQQELQHLLSLVRYPLMSSAFVMVHVLQSPLVLQSAGASSIIHKSMSEVASGQACMARAGNDKVYVVGGGGAEEDRHSSCEVFDPRLNKWSPIASLSTARAGLCLLDLHGKLYAVGGEKRYGRVLHSVECFDPAAGVWTAGPCLNRPRYLACSAAVAGKLYVIGGRESSGGGHALQTMEVFDPLSNVWTEKTGKWIDRYKFEKSSYNLHVARSGACSAVLRGKIYVMGGDLSWGGNAKSVSVYDPSSDTWSAPDGKHAGYMKFQRQDACAAAVGGKIYVAGGRGSADRGLGNTTELSSVEVYDPESGRWSLLPSSMRICRRGAAAVSLRGRYLVVIGGTDLSTAEMLDTKTGTWAEIPPMQFKRGGHSQMPAACACNILYAP